MTAEPSEECCAAARRLVLDGMRASEIADRTGLSRAAVQALRAEMRAAGVDVPDPRRAAQDGAGGGTWAARRKTISDPRACDAHLADLRAAHPAGPPAGAIPAPAAPFRPAAVFPAGAVSSPAGLCADLTDGA